MKGLSLKGQGAYFPSPQLALPLLKNLVKNLEQPSLNGGLLLWWTYQDRKEGCRWEDVKKVVCFPTLTRANTMHGKFTKKSEETLSGSLARSLARSALSLFDCAGRSGVRSAARSWEGLVSVQSLHDLLVHSRWRHCSTANNGKPEAGLSMTVVDP